VSWRGGGALTSTVQVPDLSLSRRLSDKQAPARWALSLLLMACPLCFGALEPWSLLVLQTGVVAVLLLWVALCWASVHLRLDVATGFLLLFGCLAVVQTGTGPTAYRDATQQELLKDIAYLVCFFLAKQLLSTHDTRKSFSTSLSIYGGLLSIFAIIQRLQGNGRIYWLRTSSTPTFFGPYANKNHYAGLLEMLIPFALLGAVRSGAQKSQRMLFAFLASSMIASVFLSGSRTGIAVVMFEIVVFAAVILPVSVFRRRGLVFFLIIAACALAFVTWVAGNAWLNQAASLRDPTTDASVVNRWELTTDSLVLVKQKPILGWGLGTFPTVYPQVKSWYGDTLVNAAHDDYLQLLVETGAVGLTIMLIFVSLVLRAGMKHFARAPNGVTSAALLGCCGLLLHSFTDFNLHVPANAAMFFALCGVICASES
jgi:O-antigen ligase